MTWLGSSRSWDGRSAASRKAAGLPVRAPGGCGRRQPIPKPANEVQADLDVARRDVGFFGCPMISSMRDAPYIRPASALRRAARRTADELRVVDVASTAFRYALCPSVVS